MPFVRKQAVLASALALCASVCAAPQNTTPPTAPRLHKPNQETTHALQHHISELMKQADIPGVSIALIRDGKTYWLHEFGVRNTKTSAPVTADTIFEAASLSKPVFSYGVLKLVDAGKLDLDAPLSKYLPKPYIDGDPRINQITARFVLSHRTGFRNWRNDDGLLIYFAPGERFSYSGEGFVYLQKVVEQITGMAINKYMNEAVFTPLGMTSSSYLWRDDYDDDTATGHDADAQPGEKWKPKDDPNAASSLHTTARDYATFLDALLNGKGLKPATLREMEKPQIAVNPECTNCTDRTPKELSKSVFWGLGIGIQETSDGESLWHWGDNGAFKCYTVVYPKQRVGLVYFANSENGLSIARELIRTAIGGDQPALHWVKYDAYDSAAIQFAKVVHEQGAAQAITQFRPALVHGDVSEDSINSTGYRLLGEKKTADAISIFQLNVDLYPKSANAYDSLGEAFVANNEKDLAIQNYKKALELNPKNHNAENMLKKLQQP